MLALPTLLATVFDVAHLLGVAAAEHLAHQAIIVRRLVAWMGALKRLPVIEEDLLEDVPVPKGLNQHRVTPSWGGQIVLGEAFLSRFSRVVHP